MNTGRAAFVYAHIMITYLIIVELKKKNYLRLYVYKLCQVQCISAPPVSLTVSLI